MKLWTPLASFVIAAVVAIPTQSGAAPLGDNQYNRCMSSSDGSNLAWGRCGHEWLEREEKRLARSWKRIHAGATGATKAALETEQEAWIRFKNSSCQMYESGEFGREGQVLGFPICRVRVIAARIKDLDALWSDASRR
jgi:uncharacterized protein YecT (DUF1311 family)